MIYATEFERELGVGGEGVATLPPESINSGTQCEKRQDTLKLQIKILTVCESL
jgi:hypothetical protein